MKSSFFSFQKIDFATAGLMVKYIIFSYLDNKFTKKNDKKQKKIKEITKKTRTPMPKNCFINPPSERRECSEAE